MSEKNAMVERMANAVKAAHQAMAVLKQENAKLRGEVEGLKRKVAELENVEDGAASRVKKDDTVEVRPSSRDVAYSSAKKDNKVEVLPSPSISTKKIDDKSSNARLVTQDIIPPTNPISDRNISLVQEQAMGEISVEESIDDGSEADEDKVDEDKADEDKATGNDQNSDLLGSGWTPVSCKTEKTWTEDKIAREYLLSANDSNFHCLGKQLMGLAARAIGKGLFSFFQFSYFMDWQPSVLSTEKIKSQVPILVPPKLLFRLRVFQALLSSMCVIQGSSGVLKARSTVVLLMNMILADVRTKMKIPLFLMMVGSTRESSKVLLKHELSVKKQKGDDEALEEEEENIDGEGKDTSVEKPDSDVDKGLENSLDHRARLAEMCGFDEDSSESSSEEEADDVIGSPEKAKRLIGMKQWNSAERVSRAVFLVNLFVQMGQWSSLLRFSENLTLLLLSSMGSYIKGNGLDTLLGLLNGVLYNYERIFCTPKSEIEKVLTKLCIGWSWILDKINHEDNNQHEINNNNNKTENLSDFEWKSLLLGNSRVCLDELLDKLRGKRLQSLLSNFNDVVDISQEIELLNKSLKDSIYSVEQDMRLMFAGRLSGFWPAIYQFSSFICNDQEIDYSNIFGLNRLKSHSLTLQHLLDQSALPGKIEKISGIEIGFESFEGFLNSPDYNFMFLEESTLDDFPNEEFFLIHYFSSHWDSLLSSNSLLNNPVPALTQAIHSLRALLNDSFWNSEIDSASPLSPEEANAGLKCGASGLGMSSDKLITDRMKVVSDLLGSSCKVKESEGVPRLKVFSGFRRLDAVPESPRWFDCWKVEVETMSKAAKLLDHCVAELKKVSLESSIFSELEEKEVEKEVGKEGQEIKRLLLRLRGNCGVLAGNWSFISIQRLMFVFFCSMRALLKILVKKSQENSEQNQKEYLSLIRETVCFIVYTQGPWEAAARADVQVEVQQASKLCSIIGKTFSGGQLSKSDIFSSWNFDNINKLPLFVINLDRRVDRWNLLLRDAAVAGLTLIRVRAIDGKMTGTNPTHDSTVEAESEDEIPETDVAKTWNSTLNAKFDWNCKPMERVNLSSTERACAASHLKVWRSIANIRANIMEKVNSNTEVAKEDFIDFVGESPRGSKGIAIAKSTYLRRFYTNELRQNNVTADVHPAKGKNKNKTPIISSKTDDHDYCIIFEDDSMISKESLFEFRTKISHIMSKLPPTADILYLGGMIPVKSENFKGTFFKGGLFKQINYMFNIPGYVIRGRAVDILLSNLPIQGPVSTHLAYLIHSGVLEAFVLVEPMVRRRDSTQLKMLRFRDSNVRHSGRKIREKTIQSIS